MKKDFDVLYTEAMEPFKSQLKQFRRTHNPREVYSRGIKWTYLMGGGGDKVVLVLHGGGGPAESLFRYILSFAASCLRTRRGIWRRGWGSHLPDMPFEWRAIAHGGRQWHYFTTQRLP
jgi:hypothetical protein